MQCMKAEEMLVAGTGYQDKFEASEETRSGFGTSLSLLLNHLNPVS